ncbi:lipid-A-disaccharide synthase [Aureispira anguillae]|uniref:Lipid-A-disaccharide synthase n=1 Tax=Aureispira anguillae TaxID=2864201 RepID=A0A915YBT8_9BACT|nr:lipid-A-disaccharide synthase [Aureispira anguillae]BDS10203.1 lipid-A-disaccharide synthase [Aureispira anguillae]
MKYYIISGEASGDLHGSNLVKALQQEDETASIRAWGGDLMEAAGVELVKHYKDLAFMGIGQIIKHLPTILRNFRFCRENIQEFAPDVLILIDYSGFNLRIAKWAKQQGYKVFYYISPQIWATREKRVHKIKLYVDKMFVILPFEKEFYQRHDYKVEFVGHPLLDVVQQHCPNPNFRSEAKLTTQPIIALLPGSRKQEIHSMLGIMLTVIDDFPNYQFVIAGAPSIAPSFYESFIAERNNITLIQNKTYDLLSHSHAALVTSGTATLEAALFKVPQVVCYKASALLYAIVKRIIKVRFISIVNLIMDKKVVQELIQHDLSTQQLKTALQQITEGTKRQEILKDYNLLYQKLGHQGASKKAAKSMLQYLRS